MAITRATSSGWLQDLDAATVDRATGAGWVDMSASGAASTSPGSAALTITGEQPAMPAPPGAAAITITGEAPSVTATLGVPVPDCVLAVVTEVATALATANVYPAPGDSSATFTAEVPGVSIGYGSRPDAGALSIDESATSAVQNELPSPGPATATITSHQVTLQRLFSANTESGALTVTGAAPSLLESVTTVMQPAAAALVVTGQAPVVGSGVVPIPSPTSLTATGAAPALRLDVVCSPGVRTLLTNWLVTADSTDTADGEWTADGIVIQTAPTVAVSNHAIAQPGAGSMATTTLAPSAAATTGVWSEPSAAFAAITGQQPTVTQTTSQYSSPNPCTITVECIGPTPVIGAVIEVPVATVAITQSAPSVVADTNLVISGEAPVIGVAGPGNMVMSVIRLYAELDGGRDVRLKWPQN